MHAHNSRSSGTKLREFLQGIWGHCRIYLASGNISWPTWWSFPPQRSKTNREECEGKHGGITVYGVEAGSSTDFDVLLQCSGESNRGLNQRAAFCIFVTESSDGSLLAFPTNFLSSFLTRANLTGSSGKSQLCKLCACSPFTWRRFPSPICPSTQILNTMTHLYLGISRNIWILES